MPLAVPWRVPWCTTTRRFALAVIGVAALVALAVTALAPAKEGARATLTTRVPLAAAPGTTIRVGWIVNVPDGRGVARPFNAIGMFVRLLSRTSAPATTGFASATTGHPDGRYAATVEVPPGGIGGVRLGLRGTTDVFFPLTNDPFASAATRCDVATSRVTLAAFVTAYNRGELKRLDRLFSRDRLAWYSSPEPGARLREAAEKRETLARYFRQRHLREDRLKLLVLRFNGYDPRRELGHFELEGQRRAADFRGVRWFDMGGKGALDCSKAPSRSPS